MYSWKKIRTVAAILLLIPLVHLAFIVSGETLLTLNASPEAWADEVEAYAQADNKQQLPENPIVLVGGRRGKLWNDLEGILAPMEVLNRSLGDATTNDITYYYTKLIGRYQPHTVILMPGESEFHIRDNKSADEFLKAVRELVELDLSYGITRHFYVIPPLKSPLYSSNDQKIDDISMKLKAWAESVVEVTILDANILLANRKGRSNPGYFRPDGVNLNEHGYIRLSLLLRSRIEQDNPEIFGLTQRL